MSIVLRTLDGERARDCGADMALTRITDDEIRMARALEMYRMRQAGVPMTKIARKYRLSLGYAYAEVRAIPDWQKERLRGFALAVG